MRRVVSSMAGLAMAAAIGACGAPAATNGGVAGAPAAPAPAPPAGEAASVYAGVFTAAQATRGQQVMQRECSNCHSPGDWSQGRLLRGWVGQPLHALVDNIRLTMPMDGPGRLSLQQYTDIIAYVLQLNDIPAGQTELPGDEAALQRITIEYRQ